MYMCAGVHSMLKRRVVYRYDLEGISALNFVLTRSLGGGGVSSLRIDPQVTFFAGPIVLLLP